MSWQALYPLGNTVDRFAETILTVVAVDKKGGPVIVGTAFVIWGNGKQAICITAKHVLEEVDRICNKASIHNTNTLQQAPIKINLVDAVESGKIQLIYGKSGKHTSVLAKAVNFLSPIDVAVILVEIPKDTDEVFEKAISINTDILKPGREIVIASYKDHAVKKVVQMYGGLPKWNIYRDLQIRKGEILAVERKGSPLVKGLVYSTNIPCEPGMSGGPVFLYDITMSGPHMVCGIICSDMSEQRAFESQECDGQSFISSMLLTMPLSLRDISDENRTILSMVQGGSIKDYGVHKDKIDLEVFENGDWKLNFFMEQH